MSLNPSHKYPPELPFKVGDTILDHYRIEEIQGPLGCIWYAQASYTFAPQLSYSIQILPKSEQVSRASIDDFVAENERLSTVTCPPFVPVIRSEILSDGHGVLVHEYIPSDSIFDLSAVEPFTMPQTMRIIESLAGIMADLHGRGYGLQGLTHFDLLLDVNSEWSSEPVVILHAPYPLGTPCLDPVRVYGYMSWYHAPEYRERPVCSIMADVYALSMLTSILLFPREHRKFLAEPEAFDFGSLEGFRAPILMALAPDPGDRQKSALEFVEMMRYAQVRERSTQQALLDDVSTQVFARRLPRGESHVKDTNADDM